MYVYGSQQWLSWQLALINSGRTKTYGCSAKNTTAVSFIYSAKNTTAVSFICSAKNTTDKTYPQPESVVVTALQTVEK